MKTMLKRILPFLFVLSLVSCSNSFSNQTSIVVKMPNAATERALFEGNNAPNISYYSVEVTQGDKSIAKEPAAKPSDEVVFSNLTEGEYTVTVTAYVLEQADDGSQTETPVYKGSDTKYVKAGSVTSFLITLKKLNEDDSPADDCPFYADTVQKTKFTKILTLNSIMGSKDAFEALADGQYYQLITKANTNYDEDNLVDGAIYRVTPKEGQESERTLLKENLCLYCANYYCIVLMDKEDGTPYIILTEYAQQNEDLFYDFVTIVINTVVNGEAENYFDICYPLSTTQINEYMPQVYKTLWKNKTDLTKHDDTLDVDRILYLNELNEDQLKKLTIAKINFYVDDDDFIPMYAMAGNVTLPQGRGSAIYYDADGKKKVEGSSINASAGTTILYIGEDDGGNGGDDGNGGDQYADKAGTYFMNENKTLEFSYIENYYQEAPDRCRANIDISDLLKEYNLQSGDTIVFTISGKPNQDVTELYWQFQDSNNYGVEKDAYNSYCSLNGYFKAGESFSLPMPINRIVIPDGVVYDTVQFFYNGSDTSFKIENFTLSFRFYKASKNVYECSKTVDGETIYNEFIVALKDYPAFVEAKFEGAYYFAATTTNGANISIDVLELWDGKVGDGGTWVAKNSSQNMNLSNCYIGGTDEFGGANTADLKNCLLQYKSKALYPQTPVTLVGFDITTGTGF